jgi:hypothetical protein
MTSAKRSPSRQSVDKSITRRFALARSK